MFLFSGDRSFISGQSLLIDGGRWMIGPAGQGADMRVGIEVEGTFTELVTVNGNRVEVAKVPSLLRKRSATTRETNRMEGYVTAA